jgi:amphiphysin
MCFAAVQLASKSLMDSLNEIYESQWTGHDMLYVQAQNLDMLWQDFAHKLADQVLVPLNTYQSQFPEMRVRMQRPSSGLNELPHEVASAFRICALPIRFYG